MKKCFIYFILVFLMIAVLRMDDSYTRVAHAQDVPSPTPTYDPLAEPLLPENPSEYELGKNWYWHHCMPCHGDKGQGLTDEFRAIWPEDHQDCWGYGCHAGNRMEDSFKIPTVVPSIISNVKLARFSSLQALYEYLKATHPPQYPGYLSDEQYRAIALYLFSMNGRSLVASTPTLPIFTPTPPSKAVEIEGNSLSTNWIGFFVFGILIFVVTIWGIRRYLRT